MSSPLEFADHPLESAQDGTQRIKFGALYGDKVRGTHRRAAP